MSQLPFGDVKVGVAKDDIKDNSEGAAVDVPGGARDAIHLNTGERATVLKKIDRRVLPLFSLLYIFSFLDRTNIGNAKIAGMSTDLKLVGLRYNIAAAVFFIPYCLGQVPSNIILKLVRPSRWLPTIMVIWGLIATLMCLVKTYRELLVIRVFLGAAEAGLLPGLIYNIAMLYPRAERGRRVASFLAPAIFASGFSGLLAYGTVNMEGVGGLHGWQWMFCLEGLATVLVALVAPLFIYDSPETASFLTESERRHLTELLKIDSQGLATHYNFQFVLQAFKDYKIYLQFGIHIGLIIPGYGIALFTPTIINELGFSATNAQLLSALPSVLAFACTFLFGIYSDRSRLRGPFVIAGLFIALVGFIVLYTQTSPGPAYTGVVLAQIGLFPTMPVFFAWVSSNTGGDTKRGVAIAMITGLGNLGGICASFIFFDPPRFYIGLEIIMGLLCSSMLLSLFAMWHFKRLNDRKERVCCEREITDDDEEEFRDHGDDSPLFRYTI